MIGNDKDFLTTRVSYKLEPARARASPCRPPARPRWSRCTSPARACSTASATWRWRAASRSACRRRPATCYQEGGILSPDGHCRAFDAQAQGTVAGQRRRHRGAQAAWRRARRRRHHPRRDPGSAINNDGAAQGRLHRAERRRPGRGHRDGAGRGRRRARTPSAYVEAHGTGTRSAIPIEVAALTAGVPRGDGPAAASAPSAR